MTSSDSAHPATGDAGGPIEQHAADLHRAMRSYWHLSRHNLKAQGGDITLARLEVLAVLGDVGKLSLGELATRSEMHPSTLTRIVDALEARGYVRRKVNGRDRRSFTIELSAAGRRALKAARAVQLDMVRAGLQDLTAAEQERLFAAIPLLLRAAGGPQAKDL